MRYVKHEMYNNVLLLIMIACFPSLKMLALDSTVHESTLDLWDMYALSRYLLVSM
jgi:hypothetical protein